MEMYSREYFVEQGKAGGKKGGSEGGKITAAKLTKEQRKAKSLHALRCRWKRQPKAAVVL